MLMPKLFARPLFLRAAALVFCCCVLAALAACTQRGGESSSAPPSAAEESVPEPVAGPSKPPPDAPSAPAESEAPPPAESEPEEPPAPEEQPESGELPLLILVNTNNPLPSDMVPETVSFRGGYPVEQRACAALEEMTDAAAADGVSLWLLSGYRSVDKQTRLFEDKINEYLSAGYSQEQAYVQTALYIAPPGTSEHATGLAVDLNSLEESFENTPAFAWLMQHCADYGFILRFPRDKTGITGIAYEPWHYRYVGKSAAREIMDQGLCLEEYVNGQ